MKFKKLYPKLSLVLRRYHKLMGIGITALCCVMAFLGAFFLRFDCGRIPENHLQAMWLGLPLLLVIRMFSLWAFKVHRGLYRYTSMHDVVLIFKSVTMGSLLFAPVWLLSGGNVAFMPRSIYFIEWMLCMAFLVGVRVAVRLWRNYDHIQRKAGVVEVERTLIVGAGSLGESILRIVDRRFLGQKMHVVGFVDHNPVKHGGYIHGIPVLGHTRDVRELVKEHDVDIVLFAISEPPPHLFEEIVESCDGLDVRFNTVSLMRDATTGELRVDRMRELRIEDLLGRDPVELDSSPVREGVAGRTVLVSGAGGSIGSELCRQICSFAPRRIVLFEVGETPLFEIDRELRTLHPRLDIVPVIGDIKHADVVDRVFAEHRPEFVYHAAAYKHVPLMQSHPDEAVLNNVRGTRHLAEAARRNGCRRFVMISSDKAVRPTNVMGSTKRLCELVVQSLNGGDTVFTSVRFGNVLGSNGSVIPIFKKQLENGGPLTVTHPDMTRFFMTIPGAVSLVLQCGTIATPGDIFVLDMGSPVKILDLAKNVIRLSGLKEDVDVSIQVTGLRPGEKMYEELVAYGEELRATSVPKVNVLKQTGNLLSGEVLCTLVRRLEELALLRRTGKVKELLDRLIVFDAELNQFKLSGFSGKCVHRLIEEWFDAVELPPVELRPESKGRVLAVVGSREIGIVLAEVLRCEGYELDCLSSPEEALRLLASDHAYVAVLVDFIMADSTAWQLHSQICRRGFHIPVIAMSAYDCELIADLLEMDMKIPVLPKPFTPAEFNAALAAAVPQTDAAPDSSRPAEERP